MVVPVGFPDAEYHGDLRIECQNFAIGEVGVGIECQAVSALDERALREKLTEKQIKASIQSWRADYYRI